VRSGWGNGQGQASLRLRLRYTMVEGMTPIKNIDDPRYVKAMSHPLRVRILAMLDERKASPNQLAGWLGASLGTVAYHVRTLEQLGLIELVDETRVRGAVEHHYRAKARPNVTVEGWAQAPPIAKQAAVGSSLDVIGEYARVSAAAGGFDRSDAQLRRALLKLDARGFAQLSKACEKLIEQAEKIEAAAAERIAKDPHGEGVVEAGVGLLLFEAVRLSGREEDGKKPASSRRRPRSRQAARSGG
jgi:DNA-binding transcriptional ArsR family regulator